MHRRTLLKAGVTLPLLSGWTHTSQGATYVKTQKNVMFICLDFGFMRQDLFYGPNQDCDSPYFRILDDIKGKYTFFHGTHQPNLLNSSHRAHPASLTCVKESQKSIYAMESVDQYIGSQALRETRHRTINFVTSRGGRVNWNSSAQKVPALPNVVELHRKLFGKVDTKAELAAIHEQLLILNRVHQDVQRKGTSPADKRLAQSLKVKIDVLNEDIHWIQKGQPDIDMEIDPQLGQEDQHVQMGVALKLFTDGFQHGLTKVGTFNFDGSGRVALKGVNMGYHGLSHKPKNPEAYKQKQLVDEFVLTSVVGHVKDLEKRKMLDDTIVVVSGAMGNPASHSNRMLPVFLMGGGLKHQGVYRCQDEEGTLTSSLADVYQTVIAELGLAEMPLPFCQGPIKEVLS